MTRDTDVHSTRLEYVVDSYGMCAESIDAVNVVQTNRFLRARSWRLYATRGTDCAICFAISHVQSQIVFCFPYPFLSSAFCVHGV